MPTAAAETAEQIRHRKPRNPDTDPNSSRPKTTISSILLSSSPNSDAASKKKNFSSATFRGLGCAASPQVSVPEVIRTSANWEAKKLKKKRLKTKKTANDQLPIPGNPTAINTPLQSSSSSLSLALSSSCVGAPDVWCGAGIGLSTDAASVDCVVSRRPSRGKVDGNDRINAIAPRERSYNVRRMVTPEDNPFLESDSSVGLARIRSDVTGSRPLHRHVRHGFREGLGESLTTCLRLQTVMLQNSLLMAGRPDGLDRYRDLRLDTDSMSYEELLELGDRIGYVSTGLKDDEIARCLGTAKLATSTDLSLQFASEMERKCSICQEEYEADDETGKLYCGHFYHIYCIKQWLRQKSSCPICKTLVASLTEEEAK
ncbi:probable E3 ubiquitin-protein ligase HIP1 isoform X1 [Salvia splendens]|uniref:probable E3 ubiquitin-protein ligase HIP1 isoform X1 n=1 Tax=Salvia splendens TaxID=180675 RepID=UPI001C27DB1E|nr:probable E3 ubiquitin-protein ligase HIP1 isoform X1 [Salvia splendens]